MTKHIINVHVGTPVLTQNWNGKPVPYITTRRYFSVDGVSVEDMIKDLIEIKAEYSSDYTELTIDATNDCGCRCDCDCSPTYYVRGNRVESDIEYNHRIAQETEREALKEERDRREYENLKKKFEGF